MKEFVANIVWLTPFIAWWALGLAILAGFHAEKILRLHEERRHKGRDSDA